MTEKLIIWGVVILAIVSIGWSIHHAGYVDGVADGKAALRPQLAAATAARETAEHANATNTATIAALRMSNAQCEAGRLAEKTDAITAVHAAQDKLARERNGYKAARAKLAALLSGPCKAWAHRPACIE